MTAIKEHMASIVTTTSYFERRLREIDCKLRVLLQRLRISGDDNDGNDNDGNDNDGNDNDGNDNDDDYEKCKRLQEEKESTEQCLKICVEASRDANRKLCEQPTWVSAKDNDAVGERVTVFLSSNTSCLEHAGDLVQAFNLRSRAVTIDVLRKVADRLNESIEFFEPQPPTHSHHAR
ncbi:hypothetical protein DL98DRAFT_612748 [Cadophora sp. DSE1049]|nr:hypothetical protein DL98DRAFT_612748 [Cadophora sp. DSE1049]